MGGKARRVAASSSLPPSLTSSFPPSSLRVGRHVSLVGVIRGRGVAEGEGGEEGEGGGGGGGSIRL
jgi:hypothetical protein